jgi:hypothetical protein
MSEGRKHNPTTRGVEAITLFFLGLGIPGTVVGWFIGEPIFLPSVMLLVVGVLTGAIALWLRFSKSSD